MAKKRTELEARLLEEHGRVLSVVQRWQTEQQAVDEVRASLAVAEAQVRKAISSARRAVSRRTEDAPPDGTSPSLPIGDAPLTTCRGRPEER